MNEWIKCTDKLPKEYEYVLFLDINRKDAYKCFVAALEIEDKFNGKIEGRIFGPPDFEIHLNLEDVTHWMPLPRGAE